MKNALIWGLGLAVVFFFVVKGKASAKGEKSKELSDVQPKGVWDTLGLPSWGF